MPYGVMRQSTNTESHFWPFYQRPQFQRGLKCKCWEMYPLSKIFARANIDTPPTPSKSITSRGSPLASRMYAKCALK